MTNPNKSRLVTYVTEDEHEKLRLEAAHQRTSVAAHLRKVVGDHVALLSGGTMTDNETHLSMAMSHLRKITGRTPGETSRVKEYVDSIETELERIRAERGLEQPC